MLWKNWILVTDYLLEKIERNKPMEIGYCRLTWKMVVKTEEEVDARIIH